MPKRKDKFENEIPVDPHREYLDAESSDEAETATGKIINWL